MFVTKMGLPRRTFLRGMGTTLALPLLDAMVPAFTAIAATPAKPVRRLGFIYLPNGVSMNFKGINYWKPLGEGTNFQFSPILTPFSRSVTQASSGFSSRTRSSRAFREAALACSNVCALTSASHSHWSVRKASE